MEAKHVLAIIVAAAIGFWAGAKMTASDGGRSVRSFETSMSGTNERITQLESQLQKTSKQRDECTAKFDRNTFLYDGTVFPTRRWIIPADVKPVFIGSTGIASYSHYDPKNQTETVKLKPDSQ